MTNNDYDDKAPELRKELSNELAKKIVHEFMSLAATEEFKMAEALISLETVNLSILLSLANQFAPSNPRMYISAMMASLLQGVLERTDEHYDSQGVDLEEEGISLN